MALNLTDVGLQSYTESSLCESFDYKKQLSEANADACDSGFGAAATFDPVYEFSMKGKGDIPAAIAIGTDGGVTSFTLAGVDTTTATRLFTSVKEVERNDDFNSWEASGMFWPGAV